MEQECSMMELLAPAAMVRLIDCLNIRDRVILASCSTTLSKRVYGEFSASWRVIDFDLVEASNRERLTDTHLANLLTRANTKNVTDFLSLYGCKEIRGHGLAPIRGSQVLKTVCISGTCATKNLTPFLWILQTLLPFKFCRLQVDYSLFRHPPQELKDFFRQLRDAKLLNARTHETPCSACQQPVAEESQQVIPNKLGMTQLSCTGCHKPFCKRGSCPECVRECNYCGESYCHSCFSRLNVFLGQCDFCGCSHCSAKECGGMFKACPTCERLCCRDCENQASLFVTCSNCKTQKTCLDCAKQYTVCTKGCILCSGCQNVGICSVCNEQFCVKCIEQEVRQCSNCKLVFCNKALCTSLIEHCKAPACNQVYCKQCRDFEYCITCEKSFCAMHNRLVDCFKCGVRHCRGCGFHQKHLCTWCNRPCYEDCMCVELYPQAKKAKTSEIVTQK